MPKGFRHGLAYTQEYRILRGMIARCSFPSAASYKNYGGRGIKVCERWRKSATAFYEDMGPMPSPHHSIERIDCNGDYEPGNCCWILRREQNKNRRRSNRVLVDGEVRLLMDVCAELGISTDNAKYRLNRLGWSVEKMISSPIDAPLQPVRDFRCAVCQTEFQSFYSGATYCNPQCREKMHVFRKKLSKLRKIYENSGWSA